MSAVTGEQLAGTERAKPGKAALNFWVDVATAAVFCVLLGSSFIMKWILPPGTCDEAGVKVWLGHSRHWWGDIHFWAAMLLLALIAVHIYLHWSWVTCTWRKLAGSAISPKSWALGTLMAALLAVPWLIPAQYLAVSQEAAAGSGERADAAVVSVAPCGVEGLTCADCPAASDRLFGGGGNAQALAASDGDEDDQDEQCRSAPDDDEEISPCQGCPLSSACSGAPFTSAEGETEETEEPPAAAEPEVEDEAASPCAGCPQAGTCAKAGTGAENTEADGEPEDGTQPAADEGESTATPCAGCPNAAGCAAAAAPAASHYSGCPNAGPCGSAELALGEGEAASKLEADLSSAAARLLLEGQQAGDVATDDALAGSRLWTFYGCAACHDEGLTGVTSDELELALAEVPEMAGIVLGHADLETLTAYLRTSAGP